jgi:hypothetical protein
MAKAVGLVLGMGTFGLLAAANAQTPPPSTGGAAFDGTYRLVSSAKANATYTTRKGQTAQCPDRMAGPLTIVHGRARYTSATGYRVRGTVGPQGDLTMRVVAPANNGGSQPIDINLSGTIDGAGTVHARQMSYSCSYDFVWQKGSR